jgi:vacuolar-type H+-ATPase subunit H
MTRDKPGWTLDAYVVHNEALRQSEEKFQQERDRRYAEVKSAEEKALRVKEQADRDALGLAREIQSYKDEKANQLREQISSERGIYASKSDLRAEVEKLQATLAPIVAYVSTQQGGSRGMRDMWGWLIAAVMAGAALLNLFTK